MGDPTLPVSDESRRLREELQEAQRSLAAAEADKAAAVRRTRELEAQQRSLGEQQYERIMEALRDLRRGQVRACARARLPLDTQCGAALRRRCGGPGGHKRGPVRRAVGVCDARASVCAARTVAACCVVAVEGGAHAG